MIGGVNIIDAILYALIVLLIVLTIYALLKRPRRY